MGYKLFIDDERNPPEDGWVVCKLMKSGIPWLLMSIMASSVDLDHDLGGDDTTMVFLKRFISEIWDGKTDPPGYTVHSANLVGSKNIISFMESWIKSQK